MSCGILTGWLAGQAPPVLVPVNKAGPFVGYATCDLWSGESRLTPSQQLFCISSDVIVAAIHLRGVKNVTPDTTWTGCRGEPFCVESTSRQYKHDRDVWIGYLLGVLTWCSIVASKIGSGVASKTSLGLAVLGNAVCCVAHKHAESLRRLFRYFFERSHEMGRI